MHREVFVHHKPVIERKWIRENKETHTKRLKEIQSPLRDLFSEPLQSYALTTQNQKSMSKLHHHSNSALNKLASGTTDNRKAANRQSHLKIAVNASMDLKDELNQNNMTTALASYQVQQTPAVHRSAPRYGSVMKAVRTNAKREVM